MGKFNQNTWSNIVYKIKFFFYELFKGTDITLNKYSGDFVIYFLLTGYVFPNKEYSFLRTKCEITRVSKWKQFLLGFGEIKTYFSMNLFDNYFKVGYSKKPTSSNIKIHSDVVLKIYIKDSFSENDAIEHAQKVSEELLSRLSLTYSYAWGKNVKSNGGGVSFYPYKSKLVRVSNIKNNKEKRLKLYRSWGNLEICGPEYYSDDWKDDTAENFFEELYKFDNSVFMTALHYLYATVERGTMVEFALNNTKSIEVILNYVGNKKNDFKVNLGIAKEKLKLADLLCENLQRAWDDRSKFGNIAHSKHENLYHTQLSPTMGMNNNYYDLMSSSSTLLLLKFYQYIKNVYTIEVSSMFLYNDDENSWSSDAVDRNKFYLGTLEKKQSVWKLKIKEFISKELNIKKEQIQFLSSFVQKNKNLPNKETKIFINNK
ncbi:MAG: hypothetical protein KAI16_00575 [Candidatus Pacebacteria bacterium]|nr:hypothetical protein [Candidatus Paceibacterota bacterium]